MRSVEMVKRVISLKEDIQTTGHYSYTSYLTNPDFRKFVKLVINEYEKKLYKKIRRGKVIQFVLTKKDLLDNNLIPEWSDYEESMWYYLTGFGKLTLEEKMFIGDLEVRNISGSISQVRGIIDSFGVIECEFPKAVLRGNFQFLKILIEDFEEAIKTDFVDVWFDFSDKVSIQELVARDVGDTIRGEE